MDKQRFTATKIWLRPITFEDTELIVRWRNNEAVRKNFVYQKPFTVQTHEAWMKGPVLEGKVHQFIIEELKSKTPVGSVYFRDIDYKNENAEYGIFIGEDYARGCGYGTEAARLALQYGFDNLHLHRIFLRVFAENKQAIKSYEKAGFKQEGQFHDAVKIDGVFHDLVFMATVKKQEELC